MAYEKSSEYSCISERQNILQFAILAARIDIYLYPLLSVKIYTESQVIEMIELENAEDKGEPLTSSPDSP